MSKVRYRIDPKRPPKPSNADLARLDAVREAEIDYSDLSEMDEDFWMTARRVQPGVKPVVTMRLDAETVAWFKGDDPKGYTARMAAVLRAYVEAQGRK